MCDFAHAMSTLIAEGDPLVERLEAVQRMGLLKNVLEEGLSQVNKQPTFRKALSLGASVSQIWQLTVDYDTPFADMVAQFDWTNDHLIAESFASPGSGRVKFEARHASFAFAMAPAEGANAAEELDRTWWHAQTPHLCAFGRARPDEQVEHRIVAYGSRALISNKKFFPCLTRNGEKRGINLLWDEYALRPGDRFLMVRLAPIGRSSPGT